MDDHRIRDARREDIPAIHAIEKVSYDGMEAWDLEDYLEDLADPRSIYIVAEDPATGKIIGYAGGSSKAANFYVSVLTVTVAARGNGLGGKLLSALMRRSEAERFSLHVRAGNAAALKTYKKLGFVVNKKLTNYYENEDGLYLRAENATI